MKKLIFAIILAAVSVNVQAAQPWSQAAMCSALGSISHYVVGDFRSDRAYKSKQVAKMVEALRKKNDHLVYMNAFAKELEQRALKVIDESGLYLISHVDVGGLPAAQISVIARDIQEECLAERR